MLGGGGGGGGSGNEVVVGGEAVFVTGASVENQLGSPDAETGTT